MMTIIRKYILISEDNLQNMFNTYIHTSFIGHEHNVYKYVYK